MNLNKPSEAELEILQVLWEHQPCSVKLVHEIISRKKEVGYTTTLKQMQRMLDKGLVTREPGVGKSYNYTAAEKAEKTKGKLFDNLVANAFGNSVNELMMHALGKAKMSK
ncbi:MAG: BlaI/MecI/CopY family transcriptional regulator, partial [Flavobacteriales bacterium]|nr:BlaI/MecI/CopY family transcriptional regulator [Flavobacteriales bacterium]